MKRRKWNKMKNFCDFRVEQTLILEHPAINTYFNNRNYGRLVSSPTVEKLDAIKNKSKIGENEYKADHENGTAYMHIPNGKVESYSIINDKHEHLNNAKMGDSDSKHIENFIRHHADNHGQVYSDTSQTNGSKNLWKNLIKNSDQNKYKFYHHSKLGTKQLTPENLDSEEPHVWADNSFDNDRLEIRKCQ